MKVKRTKYLEYWGPKLQALKEDTAKKYERTKSRRNMISKAKYE